MPNQDINPLAFQDEPRFVGPTAYRCFRSPEVAGKKGPWYHRELNPGPLCDKPTKALSLPKIAHYENPM